MVLQRWTRRLCWGRRRRTRQDLGIQQVWLLRDVGTFSMWPRMWATVWLWLIRRLHRWCSDFRPTIILMLLKRRPMAGFMFLRGEARQFPSFAFSTMASLLTGADFAWGLGPRLLRRMRMDRGCSWRWRGQTR